MSSTRWNEESLEALWDAVRKAEPFIHSTGLPVYLKRFGLFTVWNNKVPYS